MYVLLFTEITLLKILVLQTSLAFHLSILKDRETEWGEGANQKVRRLSPSFFFTIINFSCAMLMS